MQGYKEKQYVWDKMVDYALHDLVSPEEFEEIFNFKSEIGLKGIAKTKECARNKYYKKAFDELIKLRQQRREQIRQNRSM